MDTAPSAIPVKVKRPHVRAEIRYPTYHLADSVLVAKAVHERGGGAATKDHLAAYLGYKSSSNGAYVNRVAAARLFGLIDGPSDRMVITSLAQAILMPIRTEDVRQALTESFLRVPLYQRVYDEYKGKELPPEFGLKNALRTMFGITPQRIDAAYRALIASAETAGFFETRGSRTQLIMPSLVAAPRTIPTVDLDAEDAPQLGGGGGSGGTIPPVIPRGADDLKNEYVAALIGLLRDRGAKGEVDADLMARIEKLLGLPQ